MQQQADEDELGLSTVALAALKEFALENNLLDLDGDSDLDVRLQVQDHMDVKERAHDFCFTFEDDEGHDEQVSIALTGVNPELGQTLASTGLTVWRAAQEMARFMWEHRRWFAGKRVVELGAGLGLCGVLASKLCVGGTVVITDGGEEFTDSAMEALRRNLEKNACNLPRGGGGGEEERVGVESRDDGDDGAGGSSGPAPRCPRRSAGTGAEHSGSGNGEHDDDDNYDGDDADANGNDADAEAKADADGFVGGGEEEKGGARGAKVLLERLTWGEHADFLERHGGGGGSGGDGSGDGGDGSAVVDCGGGGGGGGGQGGVGGCGGGGGGGFDFIVAADVIYEEAAVSPLLHTVVDILKLRRVADNRRQQQQQQQQQQPPPETSCSCPPPPSVSTFLLAFARRNISIDRVLGEAERLGLEWRVPENFSPTSTSENIYLMCLA